MDGHCSCHKSNVSANYHHCNLIHSSSVSSFNNKNNNLNNHNQHTVVDTSTNTIYFLHITIKFSTIAKYSICSLHYFYCHNYKNSNSNNIYNNINIKKKNKTICCNTNHLRQQSFISVFLNFINYFYCTTTVLCKNLLLIISEKFFYLLFFIVLLVN